MSEVAASISTSFSAAYGVYDHAIAELGDLEALLSLENDSASENLSLINDKALESKTKQILDECLKLQKITKQVNRDLKRYKPEFERDHGRCFSDPDSAPTLLRAIQRYANASAISGEKANLYGDSHAVAEFVQQLDQLIAGKTVSSEYVNLIINSHWLYNKLKFKEFPSENPDRDTLNVLKGVREGLASTYPLFANRQGCGKLVLNTILAWQNHESLVSHKALRDAIWEQYCLLKVELARDSDSKCSQKLLSLYVGGTIAEPSYAQQPSFTGNLHQIGVETILPSSLRYHKVFVCPITRSAWAPQDQRPQLLVCGHMLSNEAVEQIVQSTTVQCPYCSVRSEKRELMQVDLYPELEHARSAEAAVV